MAMFKKLGFFGAPLIVMSAGALMAAGCDKASPLDPEGVCGPCGSIAAGDISISGDARLDGFFNAVATLDRATAKVNADFEAALGNLEAAFGVDVEANATVDARVDAVLEAIGTATADAELTVNVQPAQCSADVNVSVEAQAKCEVQAECDVEVDPGKVAVECKGECTGSCTAGCDGTVQCKVKAPSIACEGKCEGSCKLEAAASCEGTCRGECSGSCSAYAKNAEGNAECAGKCDGECTGSCELSVAAECKGECTGSCTVEGGEAECEGEVKCEGSCTGKCEGGCTGEVTPPKASADCEASADCQAQAKAQASASVECTPPSVDVGFTFNGSANAKADFEAKMLALKLNAPIMIGAFTKYEALITGRVNGEAVFEVAPVQSVIGSLSAAADLSIVGELPLGRIVCAGNAFEDAGAQLAKITSEAGANLAAQGKFVTAFAGGFKS